MKPQRRHPLSALPNTAMHILFFILAQADLRRTPSIREIAKHCRCSFGSIPRQLATLKSHGLIDYTPGLARTIRPTCRFEWHPRQLVKCPVESPPEATP